MLLFACSPCLHLHKLIGSCCCSLLLQDKFLLNCSSAQDGRVWDLHRRDNYGIHSEVENLNDSHLSLICDAMANFTGKARRSFLKKKKNEMEKELLKRTTSSSVH
jgi:hypothetical protein